MKPALKYSGLAPAIARSLTVPQTASVPISPPGKKSGLTTKLSVVKASRAPAVGNTTLSCGGNTALTLTLSQRARGPIAAECRQEDIFNKLPHQTSPAAVRQLHGGIVAQWNGALQIELVTHGRFQSSTSTRPRRRSCGGR